MSKKDKSINKQHAALLDELEEAIVRLVQLRRLLIETPDVERIIQGGRRIGERRGMAQHQAVTMPPARYNDERPWPSVHHMYRNVEVRRKLDHEKAYVVTAQQWDGKRVCIGEYMTIRSASQAAEDAKKARIYA